jgi:hypothetical protein
MAPAFSILQPGIVSDIVRSGPDTVRPLPHAAVPDFPDRGDVAPRTAPQPYSVVRQEMFKTGG